ncbi:MAG: hypothetical protein IIU04_08160 [Bacteroidales bacterium]|nr:hypothetical protein [Bacteroidales bacterium]
MWIRLEPQEGMFAGKQQFDGLCEAADDLTAETRAGYAEYNGSHVELGQGSIVYCLEDGKLYAKKSDSSWAEVT